MGETILIQLVIRVVFGGICASVAQNRGRSAVAWFFIGALFACIGLVVLLVIPNLKIEQERHDRLRSENRRLRERLRKDRMVADQRHTSTQQRLGVHDTALGVDTSHAVGAPEDTGHLSEGDLPPPPPQQKPKRHWYYAVGARELGPITDAEFRTLWRDGTLDRDSLVWRKEMSGWKAIADIRGLEGRLNA
ncbi:MAG: DUF4339 domain-containing protein [Planctomycetota bacterium]